jgi:uncharacterized RDD family membrane protein YckC
VEYRSRKGDAAGGPAAESFPECVAGYRLIRKLGSGGMGTVFEAEDEIHSRRVAIKLISSDYLASEEALGRFRQEGRLASAVTHPRCVFVLAVDEHQGHPYIVMELMPGTTLQNLVDKEGPLPQADALGKIADIIDGLRQFHKLGLIHRDVKPSNCFLEKDGRVKIGDFGLSKSLEGGMDLTRTGTFIGTPLYASPEQIKRDVLDERTDVYSVAATLYFLLSGRPPVRAKDAAEALARIASEPAPPLRESRPEIPRALEAVVLRGLERDPARRWRTLEEFQAALVPFMPGGLSIAGIGRRVGAFALDLGLSYLVTWAIIGLVLLYHRTQLMEAFRFYEQYDHYIGWAESILWVTYFTILEGVAGASLGKWMAGLRVARAGRGGPPRLARGLLRTLVFYALVELPADLIEQFAGPDAGPRMAVRFWAYSRLIQAAGLLALISTMRRRSGFRGPHEWLSGTRVVQVIRRPSSRPTRRLRALGDSRLVLDAPGRAAGPLAQVGSYVIRGVVSRTEDREVLLGQDSTLDRPVWIVYRDVHTRPPPPPRRNLNRRARPRWIGGGEDGRGRWDAFTAPVGQPLPEIVKSQGLPWHDVLPLLRDLSEELEAAIGDGTLPQRLAAEQVWVQAEGGVQLVDLLEEPGEGEGPSPGGDSPDPQEARAIAFLGDVARLALEGGRSRPGRAGSAEPTAHARIQAAVPVHAGLVLDRLAGVLKPYSSLERLRGRLDLAASSPHEITPLRRMTHLAIQAFFLLPGLFLMFLLSSPSVPPRAYPWDLETVVAIPMFWLLWAILSRGGLSTTLAGLALVRGDGRPAGGLACGWRTLLVWAPLAALLAGSRYLQETSPEASALSSGLWLGGLALLAAYVAAAVASPRRGLHDLLAGTVLVPL